MNALIAWHAWDRLYAQRNRESTQTRRLSEQDKQAVRRIKYLSKTGGHHYAEKEN